MHHIGCMASHGLNVVQGCPEPIVIQDATRCATVRGNRVPYMVHGAINCTPFKVHGSLELCLVQDAKKLIVSKASSGEGAVSSIGRATDS